MKTDEEEGFFLLLYALALCVGHYCTLRSICSGGGGGARGARNVLFGLGSVCVLVLLEFLKETYGYIP